MHLEHFGRYQVKRVLGYGGMATVYHAYDPHFERDVALKVLPSKFLHDPKFQKRFRLEAITVGRLEHGAIVPVYDFGEDHQQPYIVMRYLSGGTLRDWLKNGVLPLTNAAQIATRIAFALEEAYQQGVVHRDLKPSNILLDKQGNAFLSDFGIAKLMAGNMTLTGEQLIGTPQYMSPEQGNGDKTIDHRADIYALGVILYEMLTGEVPFRGKMPAQIILAHLTQPVPNIHDHCPELPSECATIISKAMAKEPSDRYQSAGEFANALQTIIGITPVHLPTLATYTNINIDDVPPTNKFSSKWWALGLMILTLLILVFLPKLFSIPPNTQLPAQISAPTPSFTTISLQSVSFLATPETNLDLLPGEHQFAGIPFMIGWKARTQCNWNTTNAPTLIDISVNENNISQLYFLIQAGGGFQEHAGKTLGKIKIYFAGESGDEELELPLVLGYNIRDWRPSQPDIYVGTFSSLQLQEIWQDATEEGERGHIDLLTVDIPLQYRSLLLSRIKLIDSSITTANSKDPCLFILALTVQNEE